MENALQETTVIQLENLDVEMLPELQGWREKQYQAVKQNPFVKITDNKSYEEGKKARTELVTARTDIQKQDKLIASKLRDFRSKVSDASKELIEITLPYENAQQEEVKAFEAKKEAERLEKERIEAERKQAIKKRIDEFYTNWKSEISHLEFRDINNTTEVMNARINEFPVAELEEFELDFAEVTTLLNNLLFEKVKDLNEKETARVEREKLQKEQQEFEAKQKEARKLADQEEARLKQQSEALAKERAELEAEKQKLAQIEEQKRLEAERQAIEKRRQDLLPDLEKLQHVIDQIGIHMEAPELVDNSSKTFYQNIILDIEALKKDLHNKLKDIK